MGKGREIRSFDYVNRPYEDVHEYLKRDALGVFQRATRSASARSEAVAAALKVSIGAIEMAADISVSVKKVEQSPGGAGSQPISLVELEWEAARTPWLFPLMRAELRVYPLTATETQIDFSGHYKPPLGLVGSAADAVLGHRIAEATVHRFVTDVASYLRKAIVKGSSES
ncbi:MAG: hypothetical protein CMJ83_17850 [Planctomycetes bacterium]|nr:hypothetical protein [Planctomycetota bacterium]